MPDEYEIRKDVPIAQSPSKGLVAALRQMDYGDSIVISVDQHLSVHSCARSVGARVKTRSNKDGTVTVWRIDKSVEIDRDIFGLEAAAAAAAAAARNIFE